MLRDGETDPVLEQVDLLRLAEPLAEMQEVLVSAWPEGARTGRLRAMVGLAVDFHTWRALVRTGGLAWEDAAAALMAGTLTGTAAGALAGRSAT